MNRFFVFLTLILGCTTEIQAQNAFYFKKWKAKEEIIAKSVILMMDSTNSNEGKAYNKRLGSLISDNLNKRGVSAEYTFDTNTALNEDLIIRFDLIKPAYVKLNTFKNKIPLCNRFEIEQLNKIPKKQSRQIKTQLAISVDLEEKGLVQASDALAELIYQSLKKIKLATTKS